MGVQELTRLGADSSTMTLVARLFADAVGSRRASQTIASDSASLMESLGPIQFSLA
jgi:hypothetical protein